MLSLVFLSFLIASTSLSFVNSFIAYDCSGLNMNITTVSLLHNRHCNGDITHETVSPVRIQLIQKAEINVVETYQCLVTIHRTIHYCGMHSHLSAVQNGVATLVRTIGEQNCRAIFKSKSLSLTTTKTVSDLRINATVHRPITLAGKINVDGTCNGEEYSDFYGSWESVIVQAEISVTLKHNFDIYNYQDSTVILKSGMRCPYAAGYCFDNDFGDTYWNLLNVNRCADESVNVLYEGSANKIQSMSTSGPDNSSINYFVEDQGNLFALRVIRQINLCGMLIYQSEHPKLLIAEDNGQGFLFHKRSIHPLNLDMFVYINTKFVYLEKHLKAQILSLYRDSVIQRCQLENQVINNHLSLAFMSPNDFAYMYMKSAGYTAQVMGEAIHIIKCQPVEVTLRPENKCYLELPVAMMNQSYYMTPRSHLLVKYGNEISCNELLAPHYFLSNTWYSFSPQKHIMLPPHDFGTITSSNWRYIDVKRLSSDGIYTNEELSQLRDHIMYPVEKHSVENIMVRNYMGLHPEYQNQQGSFLLTPYDMKTITKSVSEKLWGYITDFGNISSGVFGVYILFLVIKHTLALVFNGVSLYKTLGCGFHLLGSICTSLTHLILNVHSDNIKTPDKSEEQEEPLQEIINSPPPMYPEIPSCPNPRLM